MKNQDVLSGKAGVAGIQGLLNGGSSRRLLRNEVQAMLLDEYRPGPFHLTRAKYKPGRKLLAYFTFPVLDAAGNLCNSLHLAVTWGQTLDGTNKAGEWSRLQEEANEAGLMPVQRELQRDLFDGEMKLQLWPFDPAFPHLVRLGNPAYVVQLFTTLGLAHDLKQLPVITPIRYRPKERHVLRYEIHSPDAIPGDAKRLYAKLYTNAQDAERAFGIAQRVVDWLGANNVGLQGNGPEVMSHKDHVIFYPHAPGIPLSQQLHRSRRWLATQLHIIGKALAILHNGPEALKADLKQNDFAKEAKVVKRASEHIQVLLPETYDKILQILDQAQERYSSLPQEPPTFTHADFKADHLLSTPQGLTLIDFDTCTLTDPALDIGKFLADLEWWFTLQGISGVEEAQAELLKGYAGEGKPDQTMDERLRRARLYHVLILTKITARRVQIYKKEWAALTRGMIERAAAVLQNAISEQVMSV